MSGHAYKEELKLIHTLSKPKYFMPVHGEYRHLKHHSDLAKDGMVTRVVVIDKENYSIVSGPDIITRGFIYARDSEELINKIKDISKEEIEICLENNIMEWQVLKSNVRKSVEQLLYHKIKRRPSVFPIIMEV